MKILFNAIEFNSIPGHVGYAISRCGQVLSLKPGPFRYMRLKATRLNEDGYLQVKINQRWRSIHRLLALTYLGEPVEKLQVNHIDGQKTNNQLSNLEWVTQQNNLLHAMRTGLHPLPEKAVRATNLKTKNSFDYCSLAEAARQTGVWQSNITKACQGLRKRAGQYSWEFV